MADLGTTGSDYDDVSESSWIRGPEWLKNPIVLEKDYQYHDRQEMNVQVFASKEEKISETDWESFSQFNIIRRTFVWILTITQLVK